MSMIERARVSAAVALAEHGIPTDVQEMLLRGDGRGTVLPGALDKVVAAVLRTMREPTPGMVEAGKEVPFDEVTTGSVIYSTATEAKAMWQAMIDAAAIDTGAGEG